VQNRAMRYILGLHRFAPVAAMVKDTVWLPTKHRRWIFILRLWNRLLCMDRDRLCYKTFETDYNRRINNWSSEVKDIMTQIGLSYSFTTKQIVNLSAAKQVLCVCFIYILWGEGLYCISKHFLISILICMAL